jgi:hypothetical protein
LNNITGRIRVNKEASSPTKANVTVNDGLNPEKLIQVENILLFVTPNRAPYANIEIQSQVPKLLIDEEFEFIFDEFSFYDPDRSDKLTYTVEGLPESLTFE